MKLLLAKHPPRSNIGVVAASSSTEVGLLSLRVLIVDDSETTRRILRSIIHSQYWFVCGEAECGWSGVRNSKNSSPTL
jgi:uncharacterized membrane protein YqjE